MLYLSNAMTQYGILEFTEENKTTSNNSIPFHIFFHMLRNALNCELSLTSSSVPFIVSRYEMGHTVNQTAKLLRHL